MKKIYFIFSTYIESTFSCSESLYKKIEKEKNFIFFVLYEQLFTIA